MSRFFHGTMACVALGVVLLSAIGMQLSGIRVEPAQFLPKLGLYALVLAGAFFYRYRQAEQLACALFIVFWMGLVSDLHIYPMFLAGRLPGEFCDAQLAACDRLLGIEVIDITAWIGAHPWLKEPLDQIYYTLVFLMTAALLATTLTGRLRAAQEYVIACVCAVALTFPLFAHFQALGPWTYYGYTPATYQDEYLRVFHALKTEPVFTMDLGYTNGLITFPSFHTILALLAGLTLWSVPYLRWLGLTWALLIVVSTLTTGTHYVVDVIAGAGVAAASFAGGRAFSWIEARLQAPALVTEAAPA